MRGFTPPSTPAHRRVLFLDELPEFPKQTLESLRQPMETGRTTVARAAAHITYPARFQLVAAMNPAAAAISAMHRANAAGHHGVRRVSEPDQRAGIGPYRPDGGGAASIGGPRTSARAPAGEPSVAVAARVARARAAQRVRYGGTARPAMPKPTAAMSIWLPMRIHSRSRPWKNFACRQGATRGCCCVVGRTIADLACAKMVQRPHSCRGAGVPPPHAGTEILSPHTIFSACRAPRAAAQCSRWPSMSHSRNHWGGATNSVSWSGDIRRQARSAEYPAAHLTRRCAFPIPRSRSARNLPASPMQKAAGMTNIERKSRH